MRSGYPTAVGASRSLAGPRRGPGCSQAPSSAGLPLAADTTLDMGREFDQRGRTGQDQDVGVGVVLNEPLPGRGRQGHTQVAVADQDFRPGGGLGVVGASCTDSGDGGAVQDWLRRRFEGAVVRDCRTTARDEDVGR